MGQYKGKKGKIREWWHMAKPEDCGAKCETTPNCAFFTYNPKTTQCILKDVTAKKRLKPDKKGQSAGSVVVIDCKPPPLTGTTSKGVNPNIHHLELGGCPPKCWSRSKAWMNASGVLGVIMGVFVFAVMFLDPK